MLWFLLIGCVPSLGLLESRCEEVGGKMVRERCVQDSGRGEDDTALPTTTGPERPDATPGQYVFVTDGQFDGSLGGLSGGDAKCQLSAERAGMPGTYRAWLSSSQVDGRQRIEGEGPWRNRIGWTEAVVFGSKEELVQFPATAIRGTELGERVDDFPTFDTYVWTGTLQNGVADGSDCNNWGNNNSDVVGLIGYANVDDGDWTEANGQYCNGEARLYCFSTDVVTWPFPEEPPEE